MIASELAFLLPHLPPRFILHTIARVILSKCKSQHITALLRLASGFPSHSAAKPSPHHTAPLWDLVTDYLPHSAPVTPSLTLTKAKFSTTSQPLHLLFPLLVTLLFSC